MPTKDPAKKAEYQRRWYEKNKERHRSKVLEYKYKIIAEIRKLKEQPCSDCGLCYPYPVMEYDHVRGEKLFESGHAGVLGYSMAKVLSEIEKCDLVCANCHRIRTHVRKHGPIV